MFFSGLTIHSTWSIPAVEALTVSRPYMVPTVPPRDLENLLDQEEPGRDTGAGPGHSELTAPHSTHSGWPMRPGSPCAQGVFWLAAARAAFSNRIVGWRCSNRRDIDLILGALAYAV
ncbi:hypothetical protein ACQPWY_13920 [Pseudonocardia xinjiangensis]|uniref:hypothetical protein n=1 Tax=Pseudonocardia xinjiangensis TaxID=75289 RepID=UPI003D8AADC3